MLKPAAASVKLYLGCYLFIEAEVASLPDTVPALVQTLVTLLNFTAVIFLSALDAHEFILLFLEVESGELLTLCLLLFLSILDFLTMLIVRFKSLLKFFLRLPGDNFFFRIEVLLQAPILERVIINFLLTDFGSPMSIHIDLVHVTVHFCEFLLLSLAFDLPAGATGRRIGTLSNSGHLTLFGIFLNIALIGSRECATHRKHFAWVS